MATAGVLPGRVAGEQLGDDRPELGVGDEHAGCSTRLSGSCGSRTGLWRCRRRAEGRFSSPSTTRPSAARAEARRWRASPTALFCRPGWSCRSAGRRRRTGRCLRWSPRSVLISGAPSGTLRAKRSTLATITPWIGSCGSSTRAMRPLPLGALKVAAGLVGVVPVAGDLQAESGRDGDGGLLSDFLADEAFASASADSTDACVDPGEGAPRRLVGGARWRHTCTLTHLCVDFHQPALVGCLQHISDGLPVAPTKAAPRRANVRGHGQRKEPPMTPSSIDHAQQPAPVVTEQQEGPYLVTGSRHHAGRWRESRRRRPRMSLGRLSWAACTWPIPTTRARRSTRSRSRRTPQPTRSQDSRRAFVTLDQARRHAVGEIRRMRLQQPADDAEWTGADTYYRLVACSFLPQAARSARSRMGLSSRWSASGGGRSCST